MTAQPETRIEWFGRLQVHQPVKPTRETKDVNEHEQAQKLVAGALKDLMVWNASLRARVPASVAAASIVESIRSKDGAHHNCECKEKGQSGDDYQPVRNHALPDSSRDDKRDESGGYSAYERYTSHDEHTAVHPTAQRSHAVQPTLKEYRDNKRWVHLGYKFSMSGGYMHARS